MSPDPYGSGGLIRDRYDAAGYAVLTAALEALSTPWTHGITAPGTAPEGTDRHRGVPGNPPLPDGAHGYEGLGALGGHGGGKDERGPGATPL